MRTVRAVPSRIYLAKSLEGIGLPLELSVIIVNWNGGELLSRTVESVISFPPSVDYEIVVIDNASTDNSLALLRASESARPLTETNRLSIVENRENIGFGRANNQAFALTNSRLALLLNPDTEVTPGSIDRLIRTIDSTLRVGVVGPKLLNADGSIQVSAWRNPPAAWEILLSQLKLYLLLPRRFRGELLLGGHWTHDRERPVPMLSGAVMLVRRELIDQVGGFDERFHLYGEDNEWCWRIARAGWLLIFQPNAVVLHHGAQSSLQRWDNLEKRRVQLKASFRFQEYALSRPRVLANQTALFVTASAQYYWRRLRGINEPELELACEIHWGHLKQSLHR